MAVFQKITNYCRSSHKLLKKI